LGKRYLFWFCIGFVTTAILLSVGLTGLQFIVLSAILLLSCIYCFSYKGEKLTAIIIIISFCCSTLWQSCYFKQDKIPKEFFAHTSDISAEVTSFPEKTDRGYVSFRARVLFDEKMIRVLVYAEIDNFELFPGDRIKLSARVYDLENSEFFAERTYYKSRYIDLKAYASQIEVVESSEGAKIEFLPQYFAYSIKNKMETLFDGAISGFIKSLIFGDKSGLSDEFDKSLRYTGLSHAVSVSGMHISFILGLILCLSKRRYMKLVAIPVIVLFVFMVGAPQSALRAVIMQSLVIMASFVKREYDALTGLAVAAFILVLLNPYCATDIAFLLSFFASAGIIIAHPRIMSLLERFSFKKKGRMRKISMDLLAAISVSVSASVFTMPITAFNFGFVSVIAPLSNLLLNFFITVIFIAGFINTILGFICLPVARFFAEILELFVGVVMDIINLLAELPFAEVYTGEPRVFIFITFLCAAAIYLILVGRKRIRPGYAIFFLTVATLTFVLVPRVMPLRTDSFNGVRFDVLDVGQGQCVVATSGEKCAVIDCGGDDAASNVAVSHIMRRGIDEIDAMIITHAHADHANGVERLIDTIDTGAVYMPATDKDNAMFARICSVAGEECEKVFVEDDTELSFGDMSIKLLTLPQGADENENGIVVVVSDGEYDTLITGDIPAANEKLILDRVPDCESYIVGHHGAKTSSSIALLNKALPELSVISVGIGNTYGHPSDETIDRLENIGSAVRRTDMEGSITFYSVETEEMWK